MLLYLGTINDLKGFVHATRCDGPLQQVASVSGKVNDILSHLYDTEHLALFDSSSSLICIDLYFFSLIV
jgi:hypothetical protein